MPVGAFVKLNHQQFDSLSLLKKTIIIFSGPLANVLLSFSLFFLFFIAVGLPSKPTIISGVEVDGAAAKAGLQENDNIVSVDGQTVTRYEEILQFTKPLPVRELTFEVLRGGETKTIVSTPEKATYVSDQGIKKEHGRLGVLVRHTPFDFGVLREVEGEKISEDDVDQTKDILLKNLNKKIVVGLYSVDKKIHYYQTYLSSDLNKKYFIDDDVEKVIFGRVGNHYYQTMSVTNSLLQARLHTAEIFQSVVTIPLQLFPIDKEDFAPKTIVAGEGIDLLTKIYKFIFLVSVISIIVGLINLLPLAYLDGGRILILYIEKYTSFEMTQKRVALSTFVFLMFLYGIVAVSNFSTFSTYTSHLIEEFKGDE